MSFLKKIAIIHTCEGLKGSSVSWHDNKMASCLLLCHTDFDLSVSSFSNIINIIFNLQLLLLPIIFSRI